MSKLFKGADPVKIREGSNQMLDVRSIGNYKGIAFYLNSAYTWTIIKDERDANCLVPSPNH